MTVPPLTRLTTRILLALSDQPRHGYGLLKELEFQGDGEEAPKTGSLYVAISRLAEEGLIEESSAIEAEDARRKYWSITPLGREALAGEIGRLRTLVALAEQKRVRAPSEPLVYPT